MNLPNRKNNRLHGYDYSRNGAYFITVCTANREHLLSRIVRDAANPNVNEMRDRDAEGGLNQDAMGRLRDAEDGVPYGIDTENHEFIENVNVKKMRRSLVAAVLSRPYYQE